MRLANLDGRATLVNAEGLGVDVHKVSSGLFGPEVAPLYDDWRAFRAWADGASFEEAVPIDQDALGAPSPAPRQIVAIGLNYDAHAAESGFDSPTDLPPVFPKFVSSLAGPHTEVVLPPGGDVDWEIELVVVVGAVISQIDEAEAWDHVAGVTVGQDLSERVTQLRGPAPQFGLGKSFPGFAPTGPWLVTTDELSDPDDLALRAELDGDVVQEGRTDQLIYSVPRLLAALSRVITLYPGDLVFTGTPDGVGLGRTPQRFIQAGETLVSTIEGIGTLRQTFVAGPR